MSVMFVSAMLPPLNTPMWENLSRWASVMARVCIPPIESAAVFHGDDERLRFSLGDQVVHDQSGVALPTPARFIFACSVLQVEHRIALAWVLIVIRRRVNESVPIGVARLREVMNFAELAM